MHVLSNSGVAKACTIQSELISIEEIGGKGLGVQASRTLKAGQQLIRERPLIDCPDKLPLSSPSPEGARRFFEDKVARLPANQQELYYNLSDWRSDNANRAKNAYQIFLSNAMPKGRSKDSKGAGVFPTACRINHSCLPNCHFSWSSQEAKLLVHAVADVPPGQELGATYIEPFGSRAQRRKRLQDRFGFLCSCPACSLEGNMLQESEEIRARLSALDDEMQHQSSSQKVLQGLQEFQALLDQEGFSNPYFLGRLCQVILEGQLVSSDIMIVRHLASLACRSFLTCEGEKSDRLLQVEPFNS